MPSGLPSGVKEIDTLQLISINSISVVRYLRWLSINAQCFNVGTYRRADTPHPPADFFNVNNAEGERLRRCAAVAAMRDLIDWFENGKGTVAILDATNSTIERRRWIAKRCATHGFEVMFVESKCDDEEIIMANIREVKLNSPDYEGQDPELAAQDFARRIKNYESVYETIVEPELTYVKLINVGAQVVINCIRDYLQSRIVYYLMNLHIKPRSIWLSRVSTSKSPPALLELTKRSMESQSSTLLGKLEVMQTFHIEAGLTPRNCLNLSSNLLGISTSQYGHRR